MSKAIVPCPFMPIVARVASRTPFAVLTATLRQPCCNCHELDDFGRRGSCAAVEMGVKPMVPTEPILGCLVCWLDTVAADSVAGGELGMADARSNAVRGQ